MQKPKGYNFIQSKETPTLAEAKKTLTHPAKHPRTFTTTQPNQRK